MTFTWHRNEYGYYLLGECGPVVTVVDKSQFGYICECPRVTSLNEIQCIRMVEDALQKKFALRQGDKIVYDGFTCQGVSERIVE